MPARVIALLGVLLVFGLGNSADAFLLLRLSDALGGATFVPLLWAAIHVVKASLSTWGGGLSDRYGRKPIVVFGCALVIIASLGCIVAHSLPQLLFFRALQGAGAAAPGMAAVTTVSDLFDGATARAKMSNVVLAINIVPMIAPPCSITKHGPLATRCAVISGV